MQCISKGARPAAAITWYNGSQPLEPLKHVASLLADGTYVTQSKVRLTVSRHDHGRFVRCEAANEVAAANDKNDFTAADSSLSPVQPLPLPPQVAQLSLRVEFAPLVGGWPTGGHLAVKQATDVNISCPYTANPAQPVSVTWLKDSILIDLPGHSSEPNISNSSNSNKYWTWDGAAWLLVRNLTDADGGDYACVVENRVGFGRPEQPLRLEILSPPKVQLTMEPASPIRETDRANVTLTCQLVAGNPGRLNRVLWFMDGLLLTELPQCNRRERRQLRQLAKDGQLRHLEKEDEQLCDVDPSKLILEDGKREFHGNFSCIGENAVGRSPLSAPVELEVRME